MVYHVYSNDDPRMRQEKKDMKHTETPIITLTFICFIAIYLIKTQI